MSHGGVSGVHADDAERGFSPTLAVYQPRRERRDRDREWDRDRDRRRRDRDRRSSREYRYAEHDESEGVGTLPLAALGAAVLLAGCTFLYRSGVLATAAAHLGGGEPLQQYEEILLRRDRTLGFGVTDKLVVKDVNPQGPAHEAGMAQYIGRRIRRVNGAAVFTSSDLRNAIAARDRRTWLATHLTIEFVPALVVGRQVRAVRRIVFTGGYAVEAGSVGVVIGVPGGTSGSPARVRFGSLRFDAAPGQIEVVVVRDTMPRALISRPGWIVKGEQGERDVAVLLTALGKPELLEKMLALGMDRIDHVAAATEADAGGLGIDKATWTQMHAEAQKVVDVRRALDDQRVAAELAAKDLERLAEAERAAQLQAHRDAERWQRGLRT